MLLLGERPDIWQLLGTAMIVIGIVLIARDDSPPPDQPRRRGSAVEEPLP
jgi:drug/metabolite transporter (DMT)-like permease